MPETSEIVEFLVDKPLKILVILVLAFVANRVARKGMKRALRTLQSGAVQERLGSLRAATPEALLATTEHSLRAEQRIEALASVLRSLLTFVIYAVALFMILGEVGIELGPLLAGAGIIGVALGFGSQSLVKDFLSGVFILIEDQFGVGDIVNARRRDVRHGRGGVAAHHPPALGRRHRLARPQRRDPPRRQPVPALVAGADRHRGRLRDRPRPRAGRDRRRRPRDRLHRHRRPRRARGLGRRGARRQRRDDPPRGQDAPVAAVPRLARAARAAEERPSSARGSRSRSRSRPSGTGRLQGVKETGESARAWAHSRV